MERNRRPFENGCVLCFVLHEGGPQGAHRHPRTRTQAHADTGTRGHRHTQRRHADTGTRAHTRSDEGGGQRVRVRACVRASARAKRRSGFMLLCSAVLGLAIVRKTARAHHAAGSGAAAPHGASTTLPAGEVALLQGQAGWQEALQQRRGKRGWREKHSRACDGKGGGSFFLACRFFASTLASV